MTALLAAEAVTCLVAGRKVVDRVSLQLETGERVALMGPSGSGKTVLLSTLGGLVPPDEGSVRLRGTHERDDHGTDIAFVFQTYGLFPLLSAAENIEVALRATGVSGVEARVVAVELLERLRADAFAEHLVDELSGGQAQRVAVARALALRPAVLLADEPTTEQDTEDRSLVLDQLLSEVEHGSSVIVATHDDEVASRCDRVIELRDGRLRQDVIAGGGG